MVLNIRHVVQPVQEPMDTSDDAGVFNVELQNSLSLIHKFLQAISFLFFFLCRQTLRTGLPTPLHRSRPRVAFKIRSSFCRSRQKREVV